MIDISYDEFIDIDYIFDKIKDHYKNNEKMLYVLKELGKDAIKIVPKTDTYYLATLDCDFTCETKPDGRGQYYIINEVYTFDKEFLRSSGSYQNTVGKNLIKESLDLEARNNLWDDGKSTVLEVRHYAKEIIRRQYNDKMKFFRINEFKYDKIDNSEFKFTYWEIQIRTSLKYQYVTKIAIYKPSKELEDRLVFNYNKYEESFKEQILNMLNLK